MAFLLFSVGIIVATALASRLLPRFGPRSLFGASIDLIAFGIVWCTQNGVHTLCLAHVLPTGVVVNFEMGPAFVPVRSTALIAMPFS